MDEAVRWLSDPRTSGAYFVELFSLPPTHFTEVVTDYYGRVVDNIVALAAERGLRLDTFPIDVAGAKHQRPSGVYGARLLAVGEGKGFSHSVEDHSSLLAILDAHPYVRRVILPPVFVAARIRNSTMEETAPVIPTKVAGHVYPKGGVIDGGIGNPLNGWTLGTHTIVAPEHRQLDHGAFISGLLVAGQSLNGSRICVEPDGCELYDIGILPDPDQQNTFDLYYPRGVIDFLTELDNGVEEARRVHGVRVFNMSLNLLDPVQDDNYGIVASMFDRIADQHDVIFVISAGNLRGTDCRPEWPANAQTALQQLAARTVSESVLQPAESSRSIAVGALNPPGCSPRVEGAPAAYTRRGPGLRVGVKPDVSHYGGAMPDSRYGSVLRSWLSDGSIASGHGTSYAAPLVAKSLAALDRLVAPHLSRELLIAMLIHGCEIPAPLQEEVLSEIARQFTGFGIPKCSNEMLFTPDHAITLVFTDVLHAHRELQFDFAWPQCLVDRLTGACNGEVRMTLVYRPLLNRDFGAEFVRVNVDAHLRQEESNTFANRVKQAFIPDDSEEAHFEHGLIQHGLKWWPIKVYPLQLELQSIRQPPLHFFGPSVRRIPFQCSR